MAMAMQCGAQATFVSAVVSRASRCPCRKAGSAPSLRCAPIYAPAIQARSNSKFSAAGVSSGLTASFVRARRVTLPSAFASSEVHSSTSSIAFCEGRSALQTVAPRVERRRKGRVAIRGLFGLGVPEIAVIAGVVALVFGPKQLPAIGKSLGKTVKSFQTAAKEFESEISKSNGPEAENQSNTAIDESPKEETITSTPIATPKTPDQDSPKST